MNFKIFNENVVFSTAADFSRQLKSPKTGSVVSAATKRNEPKIKISVERLVNLGVREHVMQIPLNKKKYTIELGVIRGPEPTDPEKSRTVVIPGPEPEEKPKPKPAERGLLGHFIVIGGPEPDSPIKPKGSGTTSDPIYIELDPGKGNWHVEPDLEADVLNVSLDALKAKD